MPFECESIFEDWGKVILLEFTDLSCFIELKEELLRWAKGVVKKDFVIPFENFKSSKDFVDNGMKGVIAEFQTCSVGS